MADEQENFVPRSDEDLARLLEEQMRDLRAQTAEIQPLVNPAVAPGSDISASAHEEERDTELDEIFSALLEDSPSPVAVAETVVVTEVVAEVVEPEFKPAVHEAELVQTEPIDVVPIPSMFTESYSEEAYIAAALATETQPEIAEAVSVIAVTETVIDEVFEDGSIEETVIDEITIDGELVEEVVVEQIFEQVADANATNPVTTFERRPSFDELVFGASTED